MHLVTPGAKFPLGRVVITGGAMTALVRNLDAVGYYLERHARGDWGDIPREDAEENDLSLTDGCRILSAYILEDSTRIWVITEGDRSTTTVMLPHEY